MENRKTIFVVIVLYNITLEQSKTYQSWVRVQHAWKTYTPQLLLYNNSVQIQIPSAEDYCLVNAPQNDMLARAYNYAYAEAQKAHVDWILLLDHDTELNEDYIKEVEAALEQVNQQREVAMLMPHFQYEGQMHAVPYTYNPAYFHEWTKKRLKPQRYTKECVCTYNSGIVLRRTAIEAIGGFSEDYPLDYQDIDYLHRLYQHGYEGYVLKASLEHDLSVQDYKRHMTPKRYQMIVDAQKRMATMVGKKCLCSLRIYMICRCIKWLFVADKRAYVKQTLRNIR